MANEYSNKKEEIKKKTKLHVRTNERCYVRVEDRILPIENVHFNFKLFWDRSLSVVLIHKLNTIAKWVNVKTIVVVKAAGSALHSLSLLTPRRVFTIYYYY